MAHIGRGCLLEGNRIDKDVSLGSCIRPEYTVSSNFVLSSQLPRAFSQFLPCFPFPSPAEMITVDHRLT